MGVCHVVCFVCETVGERFFDSACDEKYDIMARGMKNEIAMTFLLPCDGWAFLIVLCFIVEDDDVSFTMPNWQIIKHYIKAMSFPSLNHVALPISWLLSNSSAGVNSYMPLGPPADHLKCQGTWDSWLKYQCDDHQKKCFASARKKTFATVIQGALFNTRIIRSLDFLSSSSVSRKHILSASMNYPIMQW